MRLPYRSRTVLPPRFAAPALVFAILAVFAVSAEAAVPPDIRNRIERIAQNWRATDAQQRQLGRLSGDSYMAAVAGALNRRASAGQIVQSVMEAMGRNPADARDTIAAALRAAPELSGEIRTGLTTAYPAHASMIATAGQAPPASVARTSRAPVPPPKSEGDPRDPFESLNRAVFGFNSFFDIILFEPVARVYRFIMPETLRVMGRNFFENFGEPVVALNNLMQGDLENTGVSLGRFAVNSTVGILGFFEVAERIDLPEHPADFGQTLHSYGVGDGGYLVLPLLGPSTTRDAVGRGVDFVLNPFFFLLEFETYLALKAGNVLLVDREADIERIEGLQATPPDYYAAARAAWFEQRALELRKTPKRDMPLTK